jgi:hypothetical protein
MEYKSWIVGVYWKEEWEASGKLQDFSKNACSAIALTYHPRFHTILFNQQSF